MLKGGPSLSELPAPLMPAEEEPHEVRSLVHPGCDCEGNQPPEPPVSGGASPTSDPGIEADLRSHSSGGHEGRRSSQELSSPGSDSEDAGGARLGRMISSTSETELELSSDGGSSSGRSSHLTNSIEEASSPASEPEPEPEPLHEPPRRPAFLPVGPDDTNSEYESGSESEPDLSEDADSPWLLSNLVSRMISEGSSPIRCPGQCLSPAPRLPEEAVSQANRVPQDCQAPEAVAGPHVELVDMDTPAGHLRRPLQRLGLALLSLGPAFSSVTRHGIPSPRFGPHRAALPALDAPALLPAQRKRTRMKRMRTMRTMQRTAWSLLVPGVQALLSRWMPRWCTTLLSTHW